MQTGTLEERRAVAVAKGSRNGGEMVVGMVVGMTLGIKVGMAVGMTVG